jgi:hypothetical protein
MSEGSNQDYQEEDITALREEYDNAKENLNQQSQTFQLFAEESQRMMRITLVFAGLLLTAITAFEIDIIGQIIGRVAKRSRLCRWYSQLRGHS